MVGRASCLVLAATTLLLAGCQDLGPTAQPGAGATPQRGTALRTGAPRPEAGASPRLLRAARGGDGDSWKDTHGVEYRLGLVNTPELDECYGQVASSTRKQLTAAGFRASSYSVDDYGRRVSVVYLADGRNLNVWLARHGYADDRYLSTFRHENPSLAAQLDPAFAAARRERAGLWGACSR